MSALIFEGDDIAVGLVQVFGAGGAESFPFVIGCLPRGELPHQRVQTQFVAAQFFHQRKGVQPAQGTGQAAGATGPFFPVQPGQ